jgi:apolipoprotein N-acyltransferase
MDTKPNKYLSFLLLLAGTLLVGFSMGRWLAPLAAWIGPVLIMRYARDHRPGRGFLFIILAYSLAFLIGFSANWASQFPLPAVPIIAIFYGFLWSLPFLADRLVSPRLRGFSSTLVYPLAVTALEFVNTQTNPIGTWGVTGFTQYGNLPLMQLASVTGMIGITFLMGWFASVANWAWENRTQEKKMLRGLAIFGVVFATMLIYGFLRLNLAPASETVRVAGITAWVMSDSQAVKPDLDMEPIWDAFFSETVREAEAGAKVVLWHEGVGKGTDSEVASLIARAQDVARQYGIYLAVPLYVTYPGTEQPNENKLLVIDPAGAVAMEHVKYGGHIIEGSLLGDGNLRTLETPFGVLSGVICWDADFPTVIQQTGQKGVGLLLVPSGDWAEIDPIHSQMAVFRAIENGMSVVRQAYGGLSIATDPYGRVLAQTDFFGSTDRTMVAQVPTQHVATIYTAFGRWFGWICFVGFLILVAFVVGRALTAGRQMK